MSKPAPTFKPRIELAPAAPDPERPQGALEAILWLGAADFILLEHYALAGPPCIHLAGKPVPENLNALDRMVSRFRRVAAMLKVGFTFDKAAAADLVWGEIDTH